MIKRSTAIAVILGFMTFASGAVAAPPNVVDQYTEQVPTPGGEKPAAEVEPGNAQGSQGEGAGAGVAGSGGDSGDGTGTGVGADGQETPGSTEPAAASSGDASSGQSAESSAAGSAGTSDDEGMGAIFPLAIIGAVVVLAVALILRRRGQVHPQAN